MIILLQMIVIICLLYEGKALEEVLVERDAISQAEKDNKGPEDVLVMEGEEAILSCQVSTPFKFCNFISPEDLTYSLGPNDEPHQDGRISFAETDDPTKVCGIKVRNVKEEDNGEWRCKVIVGVGGNVREVLGRANITVIKPPWGIHMEEVESEGTNREVKCKALGGRPAPSFSWYRNSGLIQDLGAVEERVDVRPNGTTVVEQTLSYKVELKDDGDVIDCIVNHWGYTNIHDDVNRKTIIVEVKSKPVIMGEDNSEEEVLGEDHRHAIRNDTEIETVDGESNDIRETFDLPEAEDTATASANTTSNNSSQSSSSTFMLLSTPSSASSTASIPPPAPHINPKPRPDDVTEPSTETSSDASTSRAATVAIDPDVMDTPDPSPPLPTPDSNDDPDHSEGHVVIAVTVVIIVLIIIFIVAVVRSKRMLCFKEQYNEEEKNSARFNSLEKGDHGEMKDTDLDEEESRKSTLQLQAKKNLFGSPTRV